MENQVLVPGALERETERAKELVAVKVSERKKKKLVPLNNWVLIRKHQREAEITESGLVTDVSDQDRSDVGTVVAVAPHLVDSTGHPLDIEPGDVVLYTHFSLTIEDVQRVTGDDSLQSVRGEEIYYKIEDADNEVSCT